MNSQPIPSKPHHPFLTLVILFTLLVACAPTGTTTPKPAMDTATAAPTETAIVTSSPTSAPTFTETPTVTPTATLNPEEVAAAEQAAIRTEVLSYGINLDDLTNSENEYISNHPKVGSWQKELDHSFESTEVGWETMVVLDIKQLHSEAEYNRSVTTDGGWKFIVWAKVAYKTSDNLWATANLPLYAYNEGTEIVWMKYPAISLPWLWEDWVSEQVIGALKFDGEGSFTDYLQGMFERQCNSRLDTGAIFKLHTEYPDPNSGAGAGEVGEIPRYSEELLELFRSTGDASIFEYQAADGSYFIWPFYDFNSAISSNNY
jgi:hypothetical protein